MCFNSGAASSRVVGKVAEQVEPDGEHTEGNGSDDGYAWAP